MQATGRFKKDLQLGKAYEDQVVKLFMKIFKGRYFKKVTKEIDPELYLHLDIIEVDDTKEFPQLISAECKYSSEKHDDSPNVVVEYQSYDNACSGIVTSLATYWVFKTGNNHLICRRDELLRTIIFDLNHSPSHRRIKIKTFDKKTIMLVPIELLTDSTLCPSTKIIAEAKVF